MKAYELLDSEEKWTQCFFALTKDGVGTDPLAPDAAQWCLIGALDKCYRGYGEWSAAYNRLSDLIKGDAVSGWNDQPKRTFTQVRRLLKKADV